MREGGIKDREGGEMCPIVEKGYGIWLYIHCTCRLIVCVNFPYLYRQTSG